MTTEERVERLEKRVERMEDQAREDIAGIYAKIDSLGEKLTETILSASKNECPSPGACLTLSGELAHAIKSHDATMLRVERLELKILEVEKNHSTEFNKLERQKAWILGAWSAVAFCSSVVGAILTVILSYYMKK